MSDERALPDVSRGDFLKLAGLSAFLPLIGSVTSASAAESRERVYVVTHSDDDVDRAALALLLAGIDAKKIGKELSGVTIWFTLPGAKLCRKGTAEKLVSPVFRKFGSLAGILSAAVKMGAKLGGCPFCLDFYEIPKSEYLDGLDRKGGDYVAAQVGKADVIWM
jgi:predicted peroxiredoxin